MSFTRLNNRFEKRGGKNNIFKNFKNFKNFKKIKKKISKFKNKVWDLDYGDFGICERCIDCKKINPEIMTTNEIEANNKYICYNCLNYCSYCKINIGEFKCNECLAGWCNISVCNRSICSDCKIHSNCYQCDNNFCEKHSINNHHILHEFLIPEILIPEILDLVECFIPINPCYACICFNTNYYSNCDSY